MGTIAVQRKEGDKAVKAAVTLTPEAQQQVGRVVGGTAGVPLFLRGGRQSSSAAPPPSPHPSKGMVEANLTVGAPDDAYEREADEVAKAATSPSRASETGVVGSKLGRANATRKTLRRQALRGGVSAGAAPAHLPGGEGSPLSGQVRQRVEPLLGADLSGVRVHAGPEAARAAQAINARAFTHKNHIWLGPNESPDNTELISHEATHVFQEYLKTAWYAGRHGIAPWSSAAP